MFGSLGMPEIMMIFVVALILFGPRQMPRIGKSLGKALAEFRRASDEFKRTIEDEVAASDLEGIQKDIEDIRQVVKDPIKTVTEAGKKDS